MKDGKGVTARIVAICECCKGEVSNGDKFCKHCSATLMNAEYDKNGGTTTEKRQEIIEALSDFVIRVTNNVATPGEMEALPKVAELVLSVSARKKPN